MSIKVLVIDDDEDLLFLAEKFLSKENKNFELVSARTDQEALQLLEENRYDAIVCDHYLGPESMTGLDLLEWVRNANRTVPFIIFTGRSQESVAIRALNMGADYYLKKETDEFRELFHQLSDKIQSAVEAIRAEERAEAAHLELERRVEERTKEIRESHQQLEVEIEERKRMENALLLQRDLGNNLCKSKGLEDALEQTVTTAIQLDSLDAGAVLLVNRETGEIEPKAVRGMSTEMLADILKGRDGNPIKSEFYTDGRNIGKSESLDKRHGEWTALAIIPVILDDEPAAFLVFSSQTSSEIPMRDRHTLEAISVQLAAYMVREVATDAIVESQHELMSVFDSLEDALFIVDREWTILGANTAAERLVGKAEKDLSGLHVLTLYNLDTDTFEEQATQRAEMGIVFELDAPLMSAGGKTTQTRTRIVRGRHKGRNVMFVISRPE
ncbi:response regulator [Candidatus Thorarchaeota archaeon]|nr:MAG: response regulator [Candidatus Thorarchaeota archaeon]